MVDGTDHSPNPDNLAQVTVVGRRRWWLWPAGLLVALISWNAVVFVPTMRALAHEENATMVAYRRWMVSPSQIVIDVWSVRGEQSMADMDRMLFKTAERLQGRSYDTIVLAFRGKTRMLMDGMYFHEIGATRQTQNPIYTMRTMQEHIHNPDGSPAFGVWTGGWLGVLGQQLDDHNEFHRRWWVNDALGLDASAGSI